MIVNHQAHWYPESYLKLIEGRDQYPRTRKTAEGYHYEARASELGSPGGLTSRFFDLDEQVRSLDESGIGMAVISPNMVGEVAALELGEARDTIALLNEEVSGAQRRYPDRIVGLAMLPLQDTESAIEALDRAVELDLRGVLLPSNVAGQALGAPETWPIFDRINEHGLPVFIHPATHSMIHDKGVIPLVDTTVGWVWESSLAVFSLIASGLLDRCPNIEIVHHHLGGVVPYVAGRLSRYLPKYRPDLEHSVEEYLRTRCYVDLVTTTPAAIPLAVETYGADRILFGDDYPYHDHSETLVEIVGKHLGPELAQKVLHENRVRSLRLG